MTISQLGSYSLTTRCVSSSPVCSTIGWGEQLKRWPSPVGRCVVSTTMAPRPCSSCPYWATGQEGVQVFADPGQVRGSFPICPGSEAAPIALGQVGGAYPSTTWQSGEIVHDRHNLLLPAELNSGRYGFVAEVQGLGMESAALLLKPLLLAH